MTPTVPSAPTTTPATTPATTASDLAAIERTFDNVNAAFRIGVASGIVGANNANYWVATGVYSSMQCSNFEAQRGGGVVSESFAVNPATLRATPGWVDPTVGKAPGGRVYAITVDNTETLTTTGQKQNQTVTMHATVTPSGVAQLFFRCA